MKGLVKRVNDQEQFQIAKDKFKVGVMILLVCSLLNMLIVLTIGFIIGPQLSETYHLTTKNLDINKKNNEILIKVNTLLDQIENRAKEKSK